MRQPFTFAGIDGQVCYIDDEDGIFVDNISNFGREIMNHISEICENIVTEVISEINGCPENLCGNNTLEAPKECDDGNNNSGDGCRSDCINEI
jgi:cysteine-rich repeat protein